MWVVGCRVQGAGCRVDLDVCEEALLVLGHFEEVGLLVRLLERLPRGRVLVVRERRLCGVCVYVCVSERVCVSVRGRECVGGLVSV